MGRYVIDMSEIRRSTREALLVAVIGFAGIFFTIYGAYGLG